MAKTLNITTLPEFDIGSLPLTQASIEKNIVTEHRPIAPITENNIAPIEIFVNSGIDEYIQLRDTLLRFKMKINIRLSGHKVVSTCCIACQKYFSTITRITIYLQCIIG